MIRLAIRVPRRIYVAVSGGVDSMAALSFLNGNHDVTAAFFDHGTESSYEAKSFLSDYCANLSISLVTAKLEGVKPRGLSLEEHWRNQRYDFLTKLDGTVVTAHHLDDAVETWVWSSMHGKPKLPSLSRDNIIRPFITTRKSELLDWCLRTGVSWIEDRSNQDTRFTRNYIRKELIPHCLRVNPGLHKMIKKKYAQG